MIRDQIRQAGTKGSSIAPSSDVGSVSRGSVGSGEDVGSEVGSEGSEDDVGSEGADVGSEGSVSGIIGSSPGSVGRVSSGSPGFVSPEGEVGAEGSEGFEGSVAPFPLLPPLPLSPFVPEPEGCEGTGLPFSSVTTALVSPPFPLSLPEDETSVRLPDWAASEPSVPPSFLSEKITTRTTAVNMTNMSRTQSAV